MLKQKGPQSRRVDSELIFAAASGELDGVRKALSESADINVRDIFGSTPLIKAVAHDHNDVASFLIISGADVDITNYNNMNALSYALSRENKELQSKLLAKGAKLPER